MKILMRGPFSDHSGYGIDSIGMVQALLRAGHDVQLLPTSLEVPIPPDIADLLTIEPSNRFDLAIHFLDPSSCRLDKSLADLSRINIWWSMWEWENFHPGESERIKDDIQLYDFVVGFDELSTQVFGPLIGEGAEILTVQGGYIPDLWEPEDHNELPESPFLYGMVGQMSARKNPLAAILAFSQLKEEKGDEFDAQLVIKTIQLFLPPGLEFPGVEIIYDNWRHPQLQKFYHTINALVCPSWGEGKNLPAMEATASGCPIILSDVSGHRQWAHPSFVRFVPTTTDTLTGLIGRSVDIPELKDAMWDLYENRHEWNNKALTYSQFLERDMSWDVVMERLGRTVGVLL